MTTTAAAMRQRDRQDGARRRSARVARARRRPRAAGQQRLADLGEHARVGPGLLAGGPGQRDGLQQRADRGQVGVRRARGTAEATARSAPTRSARTASSWLMSIRRASSDDATSPDSQPVSRTIGAGRARRGRRRAGRLERDQHDVGRQRPVREAGGVRDAQLVPDRVEHVVGQLAPRRGRAAGRRRARAAGRAASSPRPRPGRAAAGCARRPTTPRTTSSAARSAAWRSETTARPSMPAQPQGAPEPGEHADHLPVAVEHDDVEPLAVLRGHRVDAVVAVAGDRDGGEVGASASSPRGCCGGDVPHAHQPHAARSRRDGCRRRAPRRRRARLHAGGVPRAEADDPAEQHGHQRAGQRDETRDRARRRARATRRSTTRRPCAVGCADPRP